MNKKRLAYLRLYPVVIGLMFGSVASGQSDDIDLRSAFDQAYEQYESAFSASEEALEILAALQAADSLLAMPILSQLSGLHQGGETHAEHLQRALAIQRDVEPDDAVGRELAGEILRQALEELEDLHGKDSPNLVPVLLALGKADAEIGNDVLQLKSAKRLMEIVEEAFPNNALVRADLAVEVGRDLLYMSRSARSESFFEEAISDYEVALGPNDQRMAAASTLLGEVRFASRNYSSAEAPLLAALRVFSGQGEFQAQEVRIRTMLARIYERTRRSDEATPHLVELARLTVVSEEQEYLPIYKAAPLYPPRAAARGLDGYALVQYTVTATGGTADLVVIESSNSLFDRAALESARHYRYIPRVIDGEPVEVAEVSTGIYFVLAN